MRPGKQNQTSAANLHVHAIRYSQESPRRTLHIISRDMANFGIRPSLVVRKARMRLEVTEAMNERRTGMW